MWIVDVDDAPRESSMDDETATETAEQAVNVKIAAGNAVCNVDVKSHFCEHHSDPTKLNAINVDNNATEDFDLNVHFHEHHSDPPPSTDDMEPLDDEALTDAKIEYLFAHFSDPPLKENGMEHVISANTQLMEFADVKAHLYAHHSDPPVVSSNSVDIAVNEATMNGNLKKHLHAHHSDPPMIDAKIVAKDAMRNLDFHTDEHHSDPPERVFELEVKRFSNLSNPCIALVMTKWEAKLDHRCYPYFVPWTELEWLFKLLICMNCFCTPRILFHRWKIKIGMMQVPMMIHFQLMRKKRLVQQHLRMKIILSPVEMKKPW